MAFGLSKVAMNEHTNWRGLLTLGLALVLPGCRDLLGEPDVVQPIPVTEQSELDPNGGAGGGSLGQGDAGLGEDPSLGPSEICSPGETDCAGAALQRCAEDGSGWELIQRCATAALCEAGPNVIARCVEPACAADALSCSDDGVLQRCNSGRRGHDDLEDCQFARYCDPELGACTDAPCEVGTLSCNGGTLQRCVLDADGEVARQTVTLCASQELCAGFREQCRADPALCEGNLVECTPPTCAEGEGRCDGTRLELCNAALTGFVFERECATPELCRAEPGTVATCFPEVCQPGDRRCSAQGAIEQCNTGQTGFEPSNEQCRSAAFCQPEGCTPDPCEPGTLSCNGATRQQCQVIAGGQDVQQVALDTCPSAPLCTPEACEPAQCVAGELRCEGSQLLRCRADRTDFDPVETCQTPELCQLAVGTGSCPAPCSGFECTATGVLRGCNAGLTGLIDLEDCGTRAECDVVQGVCAEPCIEGQFRCNGVALEVCENRLDGWRRLATCETTELCSISRDAGVRQCEPRRCDPGQHRCEGQRLEACSAGLTGFDLVRTCAAGQICDQPNRQCDVCTPDATRCEGETLVRCLATGQGEVRTECGAVCAPAGQGFACLACDPAGSTQCSGEGVRSRCLDDPRRLVQVETCREPELCSEQAGICLGCAPVGSFRCDGASLLECGSDNTETVVQVCGSAALCEQRPQADRCRVESCDSDQVLCAGGEVLVCNSDLTGFVSQSPPVFCDTPQLCSAAAAGGCLEPVCDPGESRCVGQTLEVCNAGRTEFVAVETCDSAALCSSSCAGGGGCCLPRACNPGEQGCLGDDVMQCNAGLTGVDEFVRSCGAGLSCVEPTGTTAECRCQPGELRCTAGGVLQRCDGTGVAFVNEPACSPDGTLRQCSGGEVTTRSCGEGLCSDAGSGSCLECAGAADCEDGNQCTSDTCVDGACVRGAVACDDGLACNGAETCNPNTGCVNGSPLCGAGTQCSEEGGGTCLECIVNADCAGAQGSPFCVGGACVECAGPQDCDDGLACNGAETCSVAGSCVGGTPLCPGSDVCDELDDVCVPPVSQPDAGG